MCQQTKYQQLLASREWKEKRETILQRDGRKCQRCENKKYLSISDLQVSIVGKHFNYNGQKMVKYIGGGSDFVNRIPNSTVVEDFNLYLWNIEKKSLMAICSFDIVGQFGIEKATKLITASLSGLSNNKVPNWLKFLQKKPELFTWNFTKNLQVHHTYYQLGKMPWEYPDDSLQTLCGSCHQETHAETETFVLDEYGQRTSLRNCNRCKGTGHLPQFWYFHSGICFACNGNRFTNSRIV